MRISKIWAISTLGATMLLSSGCQSAGQKIEPQKNEIRNKGNDNSEYEPRPPFFLPKPILAKKEPPGFEARGFSVG